MLDDVRTHALVDSGNSVGNAISWELAQRLGLKGSDICPDPKVMEVRTAQENSTLHVLGRPRRKIAMRLGGLGVKFKIRPLVIKGLSMEFNLAGPFLAKHQIDQLHSENALKVQGRIIPLSKEPSDQHGVHGLRAEAPQNLNTYVARTTRVAAMSAAFIPLRLPDVEAGRASPGTGIVQAQNHFMERTDTHPLMATLVEVKENGRTWTSVVNSTDEAVTIPEGVRFGECEIIPDVESKCNQNPEESKDKQQNVKRDTEWYINQFQLNQSPVLQRPEDLQKAVKLLQEYGDLFSDNDEYGRTSLVEHAIHTENVPPIKSRHRPVNPAMEPQLREQVDHWLKQEVIEPSNSPWSFPLLAVPKKNGKTRWVLDYRRLNDITIKDNFPLPHIEDNLARMAKSTIFSGIDGTGAYHVVSVKEEDKEKTAFSTPWGLFQFRQMPFGLCNAPATYCRLVQKVLDGIPLSVAVPYLDDTCVHSPDLQTHLDGLRQVLQAHREAGLTLQPAKCQLFKDQIEYLGHVISAKGIAVPPEYVDVVKNWPVPTSVKDVRVFLGKVSYYRRFIKDFSSIAAPLTDLTKLTEDDQFQFPVEAQEAFRRLREALTAEEILAYPRFDGEKPFILDTDWSQDPGAIGGVLSQEQDGEERVIAYGAKKLKTAEKNYSSHKGELLAAIFFIRHWKYYLSHAPFILRTDHEALKWIHTIEEPKGMILRWLETLANYNFTVQFRRGKQHGNADALSRVEHAEELDMAMVNDDGHENPGIAALRMVDSSLLEDLRELQQEDEVLGPVRTWVETNTWPSKEEIKSMDRDVRSYYSIRATLFLNDEDVLARRYGPSVHGRDERLCIPQRLQAPLLLKSHMDGGHRGGQNTYEQFTRKFYFPGAAAEAGLTVKLCHVCQRNKAPPKGQRAVLASDTVGTPFQKWSIDFVGPLPQSDLGHSYILTAKDCFTRWVEAFPTANMTAATVARTLEKELFARYGIPEQIHSDQGTQFTSELMREVYKELGIRGTTTPAYNPKSNPVERSHRDLGQLLRACVNESPQDWESFLPDCLLAMRIAQNRSTGFSPFFLVYGRECVMPLDLMYGGPPDQPVNPVKYVNGLRERLTTAFRLAREQQGEALRRARQQYTNQPPGGPLAEGDKVWLYTPKTTARSRKLQKHWTGPWYVEQVITPVLFRIRSGPWNSNQMDITAGLDRLRRYHTREEPPVASQHLEAADVDVADEFMESNNDDGAQPPPEDPGEGGGDDGDFGPGGGGPTPGLDPPAPPPPPSPPPPPRPPTPRPSPQPPDPDAPQAGGDEAMEEEQAPFVDYGDDDHDAAVEVLSARSRELLKSVTGAIPKKFLANRGKDPITSTIPRNEMEMGPGPVSSQSPRQDSEMRSSMEHPSTVGKREMVPLAKHGGRGDKSFSSSDILDYGDEEMVSNDSFGPLPLAMMPSRWGTLKEDRPSAGALQYEQPPVQAIEGPPPQLALPAPPVSPRISEPSSSIPVFQPATSVSSQPWTSTEKAASEKETEVSEVTKTGKVEKTQVPVTSPSAASRKPSITLAQPWVLHSPVRSPHVEDYAPSAPPLSPPRTRAAARKEELTVPNRKGPTVPSKREREPSTSTATPTRRQPEKKQVRFQLPPP